MKYKFAFVTLISTIVAYGSVGNAKMHINAEFKCGPTLNETRIPISLHFINSKSNEGKTFSIESLNRFGNTVWVDNDNLMLASGEGTVKLGILGREKNYCAQGGTDVKQFTIGENLMITTRTTAVSVCSQLGPKRLFGFNEKITISIEDTVHGALTDAETTITEKYSTLAKCNSELHRADVEFTHP